MFVSTRDHRQVGYKIPREWETLTDEMRKAVSIGAFKRQSKGEFIKGYGQFSCLTQGCYVCGGGRGQTEGRSQSGAAVLVPQEFSENGI